MKNFIYSCLFTILITCRANPLAAESAQGFKDIEFDLGYATGDFISIGEDYAIIGMYAPFVTESAIPFLDVHGFRFNDGKWAASAGFGFRFSNCDFNVLGFNIYYDYRRGNSKHDFHQAGVGLEWLTECWAARINGYFPFSEKKHRYRCCNFNLGDGFFASNREIEWAYSGFDASLETILYQTCNYNFYVFAGPYYYTRKHYEHFWGGFAGVEFNWKSLLSLQVKVSHDDVYSTNTQGIIQLSIPFDFFCNFTCSRSCECNRFATRQVQRNRIILTDSCCDWNWNWDDRSR